MEFLVLASSLAMLVWAAIALHRGSVFLSTAIFIVATSCFPSEFVSVDAIGLTWTLDRLWFFTLVLQAAIGWYQGKHQLRRLEYTDLAIGLFALWLLIRTITQPLGSVLPNQPPTLMHLINGYLIPFTIYFVLRTAAINTRQLTAALGVVLALSAYLGVTAILEVAELWSFVFPRFISDPQLGIHFGRARGPMLQSVRLGMCLIIGWVSLSLFTVWTHPKSKPMWILFLGGTGMLFISCYLTYTRSIWMGLALAVVVVTLMVLQGYARRVALVGMLASAVLVGVIKGPDLVAFKREYSAAETKESTLMRAAFAYVSLQMFYDKPIAGHGFNQFQVHNGPYLSDRSTEIRLDSIRGYVHHNGFLSLLVDLGVIGLALYLFLLLAALFQAVTVWQAKHAPQWVRGLSVLSISFIGVHSIQMTFHELSFSTIENGLLFGVVGLLVAAHQQYCLRSRTDSRIFRPANPRLPASAPTV